jgi:hypothetical protein
MARRVQEEIEATNARIGNLALLATPHRQNLVAAINDLRGSQSGGANLSADPGNAIGIGSDGGLYCPAVVVSTLHW